MKITEVPHGKLLAICRTIGRKHQEFWPVFKWFYQEFEKVNEFDTDTTYTQVRSVINGYLNEDLGFDIPIPSKKEIRRKKDEMSTRKPVQSSASSATGSSEGVAAD